MRNYDIENPTIATRIPGFLKEQLRVEAEQNNMSLAELIRDYISRKFAEIISIEQAKEFNLIKNKK